MSSITINPEKIKYRENDGKVYFTYNDIRYLPEFPSSPLIEILQGELYVVPVPTPNHQRIVQNIFLILQSYIKANSLGEVFFAPLDVVLSAENVVIPDLVFVSTAHKSILTDKNIQGIPDLVIEVLSTNQQRDLVFKKQLYLTNKVKEYLIIDPFNKLVRKYLLDEAKKEFMYQEQLIEYNGVITFNTLPGLIVNVKDIFSI